MPRLELRVGPGADLAVILDVFQKGLIGLMAILHMKDDHAYHVQIDAVSEGNHHDIWLHSAYGKIYNLNDIEWIEIP